MNYYYIYQIKNKINEKTYIGQHRCDSLKIDSYMGSGVALHKAYKKYGKENFEKTIILSCENSEQADFYEKQYIKFYRLAKMAEYNIADGGAGNTSNRGKHFSEERKHKMSIAHKGLLFSEEHCNKLSTSKIDYDAANGIKIKIIIKDIQITTENYYSSLVKAAEGLSRSIGKKVSDHFISRHINEEYIYVTKDTHKTLYISIIEVSDQDFLNLKKELVFYENYRNISKLIDEDSKYVHVNDYIKQFIKANPDILEK
jgi:hypothetical protein